MPRILIIGSTSPIARELAMHFAGDGARLYLAARDAEEAARIAADVAIRGGVEARSGAFEAADFESHPAFMARVVEELGGLDGVVLCFGTLGDQQAAWRDSREALAIINQNYTGAVSILTLCAARLEAQHSGFIVVIGSVSGDRGRRGNYAYGSAKGGLALFAQGLRARLAEAGVHVMTVKPGYVDSRMTWGRPGVFLNASPAAVAGRIHAALKRKADVIYAPAFWRLISGAIKLVPERIFKRINI